MTIFETFADELTWRRAAWRGISYFAAKFIDTMGVAAVGSTTPFKIAATRRCSMEAVPQARREC